jgi:Putative phage tail protein
MAVSYIGAGEYQAFYNKWGYGAYYTSVTNPPTTTTPPSTTTTPPPLIIATPPTPVPAENISSVTGIDPAEVAAATYGKIIPMFAGGLPRLGCHIIYGPNITTAGGIAYASFGVSFGMPAWNSIYSDAGPLTGSRELRELRLDGFKVWTLAEGLLMQSLIFRFYPGTEAQATDPLISAEYPTAPVAHKGQCCVFIENLALTNFAGKVPFVSAVIADTTFGEDPEDGIGLAQALTHIAGSRLLNLNVATGGDFSAISVTERVDAVIVAEKYSFVELCNRFARLHLWDVVQTDKLEVIERGDVVPDITLDLTHIITESGPPILIERQQQSDIPRELDYSYIDSDRDYEINTVTARRPRAPVPATVSAGKESVALPAVHSVQEALSWATLRRFKDELARETISFTTTIRGYGIEPGDIVQLDAGFKTYTIRVLETLKGANWTNRIKGEPVLRCDLPS